MKSQWMSHILQTAGSLRNLHFRDAPSFSCLWTFGTVMVNIFGSSGRTAVQILLWAQATFFLYWEKNFQQLPCLKKKILHGGEIPVTDWTLPIHRSCCRQCNQSKNSIEKVEGVPIGPRVLLFCVDFWSLAEKSPADSHITCSKVCPTWCRQLDPWEIFTAGMPCPHPVSGLPVL